jgi:hypothetical protein
MEHNNYILDLLRPHKVKSVFACKHSLMITIIYARLKKFEQLLNDPFYKKQQPVTYVIFEQKVL